jgi:hypothetical protein
MRFTYISPSALPSRTANSLHVVWQCDALARAGAALTLYAKRTMRDETALIPTLADAYGVDAASWRLVSYHSRFNRADTFRTAALALLDIGRRPAPDAVLSRNLHAAFVLAVLERRPLIFEMHQLERGVRLHMQRAIMSRPWVTTVTISEALAAHLTTHHGLAPARTRVLPDAAPRGMRPIATEARRDALGALVPETRGDWAATCAYFGHLYPGRGIEIIEKMAEARPSVAFLVFGGTEADLARRRAANMRSNLYFLGHRPHDFARRAMAAADVLLMPYQTRVSIGVGDHDTAKWMSPMKMFEYLASGVPIISSDLPVLREVLEDGRNALLVAPDRPDSWVAALDRLVANPELARKLGQAGHADYLARYTWDNRASQLLAIASET